MKFKRREAGIRLRLKEPIPDMEPDDTFDVDQCMSAEDWKSLISQLKEELADDQGGITNALGGIAAIKEFFPQYISEDISPSEKFSHKTIPGLDDYHGWESETWWAMMVILCKWSYPQETKEVDPKKINPRMFEHPQDWEEQAYAYLLDPISQTLSDEGIALMSQDPSAFNSGDLTKYALLLASPRYREQVRRTQLDDYKGLLQSNMQAVRRGVGNARFVVGVLTTLLLATAQEIDFVDGHFKITPKKSQTPQTVELPPRSHV